MFKISQLKNKRFVVFNERYRFKEEWLLQAVLLEAKTALDFIEKIEHLYANDVEILREWYVCEEKNCFEDPAGLRLEFLNKKFAEDYCARLNTLGGFA
jgi:hypothetical protein